jgi:hypothetical protein
VECARTRIGSLVAGILGFGLTAAGALAADIRVEEGEDTLQAAIDAAAPGDRLLLEPGLYTLSHTVFIDKSLILRGHTDNPDDVHIAAVDAEDFDFDFGNPAYDDPIADVGHLLFAKAPAQRVVFAYLTVKNAPENPLLEFDESPCTEAPPTGLGLNLTECFGDAIHSEGVASLEVRFVNVSLNAGNGIYVDGADTAVVRYVEGVNNGAFGVDIDSANLFRLRHSRFTANQISGVEASGHGPGLPRDAYTAHVNMEDVTAVANGEIGIEIERFRSARIDEIRVANNREDGFDADRVGEISLEDSEFVNNLSDGIEMFPVNVAPEEQPADFPGSTAYHFDDLEFSGNAGEDILFAATEN